MNITYRLLGAGKSTHIPSRRGYTSFGQMLKGVVIPIVFTGLIIELSTCHFKKISNTPVMTSLSRLSAWPRVAALFTICFVLHAGTCQHGTHRLRVKKEEQQRLAGAGQPVDALITSSGEEPLALGVDELWAVPRGVRALALQPRAEGMKAMVHQRTGECVEIPAHDIEGLPRELTTDQLRKALEGGLKACLYPRADGSYRLSFEVGLAGGAKKRGRRKRRDSLGALKDFWKANPQKQGQLEDTNSLVEAFGKANNYKERAALRRWIEGYVSWFKEQPLPIKEAYLEDYLALALAQADPDDEKDMELMLHFFENMANKIETGYVHGEAPLMEVLATALPLLDPAVFEEQTTPLIRLSEKLLTKLSMLQGEDLTMGNYPAHKQTLGLLCESLGMLRAVMEDEDWGRKGLYSAFKKELASLGKKIPAKAELYPYHYQLGLVRQRLKRLKEDPSWSQQLLGAARRLGHGVQGTMQLAKGLRGILSLKVDLEALQGSAEAFKKAFAQNGIKKEAWYELLSPLGEAAYRTLEAPKQHWGLFTYTFRLLQQKQPKKKAERLALRYGMVGQVVHLGRYSTDPQVCQGCQKLLVQLAADRAWCQDGEIQAATQAGLGQLQQGLRRPQLRGLYEVVFDRLKLEDPQEAMLARIEALSENLQGVQQRRGSLKAEDVQKAFGAMQERMARLQAAMKSGQAQQQQATLQSMAQQQAILAQLQARLEAQIKQLASPTGGTLPADGLQKLVASLAQQVKESGQPAASPAVQAYRTWCSQYTAPALHQGKHNLPAKDQVFVGREKPLAELDGLLQGQKQGMVAVTGIGGRGKTSLARRYGRWQLDDGHRYKLVWQVSGADVVALEQGYQALAKHLGLKVEKKSAEQLGKALFARLEAQGRWLLIVDNVDNQARQRDIIQRLPLHHQGHVLVTSRLGTGWEIRFSLEKLTEEESIKLLHKYCPRRKSAQAAKALAKLLDYSPLALRQAGCFLQRVSEQYEEKPLGYEDYVRLYRNARAMDLKYVSKDDKDYEARLTTLLSVQQLGKESPKALSLVQQLAYLIQEGELPQGLLEECSDAGVREVLERYGIVISQGGNYKLHAVVGEMLRTMYHEEGGKAVAGALALLKKAWKYDDDDPKTWQGGGQLLPHVSALRSHAHLVPPGSRGQLAALLHSQGLYYSTVQASYAAALKAYQGAMEMYKSIHHGKDHPDVASTLMGMGLVYRNQGAYEKALAYYEDSLKMYKAIHQGKDHPEVADTVENIGLVYGAQSLYQKAAPCYEEAYKTRKVVFGEQHAKTKKSLRLLNQAREALAKQR